MLKNTARKIAFILVLALCGCTQSSFENNLAQVTEEPSSCLPLNLRSDPTVQPAIQFNLQCTQNSCGQLYYSCTGNSTCNQGICTACDLNQTGCLLAESLRTTQATSQLKACKGDEKCLPWMCVDTQSNANYCGACGKECASGESCVRGICSTPQYLVYSGLRLVLENNAKLDSNDTRGTLIALGAAVDVNGSDRRPIMTRDGKFVGITTLQLGGDVAYPNNTKVVYTDQFITDATNNTASLYLNTDGKIGAYYGGGYLYNLVGTTGNDFFFYFFYSDKPDPKIHSWKLCTPTDTSCLKPLPPPTPAPDGTKFYFCDNADKSLVLQVKPLEYNMLCDLLGVNHWYPSCDLCGSGYYSFQGSCTHSHCVNASDDGAQKSTGNVDYSTWGCISPYKDMLNGTCDMYLKF